MRKYILIAIVMVFGLLSFLVSQFHWLSNYYQLLLMMVGINIILTLSLNVVNGFMGEFSVGHAGFMSIGAYVASLLTLHAFSSSFFIVSILSGGIAAAIAGVVIALLSFRTRGDYLAILTLAFLMIVKSVIENIQSIGGARGLSGISHLTSLSWVFFWLVMTLLLMRNLIYSRFGRNILAIREDEMVARLMGVNTRQAKILAFAISAFFTGIAGGLYAHLLQFINPAIFNLSKSTDILIMVYLGGAGSLSGSIISGTVYTLLMEALRPLGAWRMVIMPVVLILLMIFRPSGIMGYKEFFFFRPYGKYLRSKSAIKT